MQHLLPIQYEPVLERALAEDIGSGDITANVTIPADRTARAIVLAKSEGVLAGLAVACQTFSMVDHNIVWEPHASDGERIGDRQPLATITGPARGMLSAERVALNVLQRMSGTATMTARFVALTEGTNARIVDTRKTTPGLRLLEKVRGPLRRRLNHRFGLYDCVLIKDNHLAAGGGVAATVARARAETGTR
jgi:nicotinate-nucleotide pyrophosphorylase (carboxylating)